MYPSGSGAPEPVAGALAMRPGAPPGAGDRVTPGGWACLALAEIALVGVGLGYWLYQIEFAYIDVLRLFDYVDGTSWSDVGASLFQGGAQYRPLRMMLIKAVYDGFGPAQVVFRTIELGAIMLLAMLFFALCRPRHAASWLGFTAGFCCLVGLHTARPMLASPLPLGYPLLPVSILVFGSLLLLRRRPHPAVDAAAFVLSIIALFLIEAGIVVAVLWLVAGACRWGGARWRTAACAVLAVAPYVAIRLLTNDAPLPGPFSDETGLLFQENVTPAELARLFAGRAWLLYGYNIGSTLLTVVLSEPRAGVFVAGDAVVHGTPVVAWQLVNWTTSGLATALILVAAIGWWRGRDEETRRLVVLCLVVLFVSSALSYQYTRDRIPGVGGACYALLLGLATEALWTRRARLSRRAPRVGLAVLLVLLAAGWALRAAGTVVWARDTAWSVRDEWTDRYERLTASPSGETRRARRTIVLREELRRRALARPLRDPREDPEWMRVLFERQHF